MFSIIKHLKIKMHYLKICNHMFDSHRIGLRFLPATNGEERVPINYFFRVIAPRNLYITHPPSPLTLSLSTSFDRVLLIPPHSLAVLLPASCSHTLPLPPPFWEWHRKRQGISNSSLSSILELWKKQRVLGDIFWKSEWILQVKVLI